MANLKGGYLLKLIAPFKFELMLATIDAGLGSYVIRFSFTSCKKNADTVIIFLTLIIAILHFVQIVVMTQIPLMRRIALSVGPYKTIENNISYTKRATEAMGQVHFLMWFEQSVD